jgi:hypothetical protein
MSTLLSTSGEELARATPFGEERAREIWAERRPMHGITHAMTREEVAYVSCVWLAMPSGERCWMDAFFAILNRRVRPPA